jgi:hypothetical protein
MTRISVLGVGDLATRAVTRLQASHTILEIDLVSRARDLAHKAELMACLGRSTVNYFRLDLLNRCELKRYLDLRHPEVIINCAALMSPWIKISSEIGSRMFGAHLCAQLPPLFSLMQALSESGLKVHVVNCSYPDVTNHVMAKLDFAPSCGVGNIGMLVFYLARGNSHAHVRMAAHHAVVQSLLCNPTVPQPLLLEINGKRVTWQESINGRTPLLRESSLNSLTSAHLVEVVLALVNPSSSLQTHLPGPLGLQGGYPCQIDGDRITVVEGKSFNNEEAAKVLCESARLDGIDYIDKYGTTHFTQAFRESLSAPFRYLGDPLSVKDALSRFTRLSQQLDLCT